MRYFLFTVLGLLLSYSVALASIEWPNEPAGSSVLLDCPLSVKPVYPRAASSCNIENFYNAGSITQDSTAPFSPSNVFKSAIQAGQVTGGSQLNYATGALYNEVYFGIIWRTNPEFRGRPQHDKMFFIKGPNSNGFFGLYTCPGCATRQFGWGVNAGYDNTDDRHVCGDSGLWCYPNSGGNPAVTIGTWAKIEVYIKKSSTSTSRDGIVRWWINGIMAGNYTTLNHAPNGLNEWVWTETWDGALNPPANTEWAHFIDHVHMSIPSGGVVDPPPPPVDTVPGKPAQVTGVSATVF